MSAAYRYDHFKRELFWGELSFKSGPAPGQSFPDFDLETTDGEKIRKADFVGKKPVLMTLGSVT